MRTCDKIADIFTPIILINPDNKCPEANGTQISVNYSKLANY